MKKLVSLMLSVLLIISLFSGCSGKQASSDVVKVGWIGSLTGDQAVWGISESSAVEMFFEEINNNGGLLGKKIEVVKYDTRGDGTEAVNAVRRLTGQDKVIAIIGPNSSGQAIPISSVLEEMKVPDIATVATNPKVTVVDGKVKPYNFRVCFIDPYQGAVAAGYAIDVLKFNKAAILYDVGDDYSQGLTQYFEETFTKKGGKIVAKEGFKSGDVDFRAQLTKIKDANPDVIFMPYFFKEVALSAKQARELGIKATFIGGDGWTSDQLISMAKDAIEGSYYVNHLDYNDPTVQDFKNKYKEKFGKDPELNGYLAYDACSMLVEAIKKANSFEGEKIKDALETVDIVGITGKLKIGKDSHNPEGKDAAIIKIENGALKFIEKYQVQ
ncbi:Leucine-, isoleucine-, valine-, threonine-, and alanine-binding protein precursor [Caloramator mitchellensis]|uniref:Leucine-, isoleucine-, valine-, threonine-, and alanine-binding protein n=1 Tax=Caloramator mitchellensis TaxID=908809 RepID=A0A0R3JV48_CALMK|nr:ABC transporter substrate-binding protein [Caloramator mitchellensis]KRQ87447.1 Leucine-, isoleucine-, valine-, threonine-, and alanine-binding protein precursor [Caloramator mitchellensis]